MKKLYRYNQKEGEDAAAAAATFEMPPAAASFRNTNAIIRRKGEDADAAVAAPKFCKNPAATTTHKN
jgi:hypothetical protein